MITYLNKNQLPLLKTEPFHIVFRSKARLGQLVPTFYDWGLTTLAAQPTPNGRVMAAPRADLDPAKLYAIENFTFSADIDEADFSGAIIDDSSATAQGFGAGVPRFHLYVLSESTGPILKQPIPLPQYYQDQPFPKWREYTKEVSDLGNQVAIVSTGMKRTNQFQGAFEARLTQTAALFGKQIITLILSLTVLEISDENFIRDYKAALQKGGR